MRLVLRRFVQGQRSAHAAQVSMHVIARPARHARRDIRAKLAVLGFFSFCIQFREAFRLLRPANVGCCEVARAEIDRPSAAS